MQSTDTQPIRSLADLRSISSSEPSQVERRIVLVERDLGLVVKGIALVILFYFLYWTRWAPGYPVNPNMMPEAPTWVFAQQVLQYAFLVYLAFNIGAAFVFLGMAQVSFPVVPWTVFIIALADGLFLGGLIAMTGGLESPLYWLYLVLIVRNCASVSAAMPQYLVNISMMLFYFGAVVTDMAIAKMDAMPVQIEIEGPIVTMDDIRGLGTMLWIRLGLLAAVAAWCRGLQILLDRQQQKVAEQQELAVRRQQLEAAARLAAEIAHQLKNPLTVINNASYTLQKTLREGKTITQQIQIIREEVEKSDRLITDLMGYAKLNEGIVEGVDLQEELDRAVESVFPPAVKYDVQIHRDYASHVPPLLAHKNNVLETFTNILQNARDAMNGHGNVWLTLSQGPNRSVQITIADDGPGIAPENLEKIFQPYFTTRETGTGLGLAIVKHNVETYGGRITVESELGKGTRFVIAFPARTLLTIRR